MTGRSWVEPVEASMVSIASAVPTTNTNASKSQPALGQVTTNAGVGGFTKPSCSKPSYFNQRRELRSAELTALRATSNQQSFRPMLRGFTATKQCTTPHLLAYHESPASASL